MQVGRSRVPDLHHLNSFRPVNELPNPRLQSPTKLKPTIRSSNLRAIVACIDFDVSLRPNTKEHRVTNHPVRHAVKEILNWQTGRF